MILTKKQRFELFTAFIEELWEKGITPYVVCDFNSVKPPTAYTGSSMFDLSQYSNGDKDKRELILNISTDSIGSFSNITDDDTEEYVAEVKMRFSGKAVTVNIPYDSIKIIYGYGSGFCVESPVGASTKLFGITKEEFPNTYNEIIRFQEESASLFAVIEYSDIIKFLPILDRIARKLDLGYYIQMVSELTGKYVIGMTDEGSHIEVSDTEVSIKYTEYTDEVFQIDSPELIGKDFTGYSITIDNIFTIPENDGRSLIFMDKIEKKLVIMHPGFIAELQKENKVSESTPEPKQEENQVTQEAEVIQLKVDKEIKVKENDAPAKVINFADYRKK